jgi:hypothetical protein
VDVNVVAGGHHLVQAADVIAVLMAGDGVVEAGGRLDADGPEVRHDAAGAHAGVPGLEQDGGAAGPLTRTELPQPTLM